MSLEGVAGVRVDLPHHLRLLAGADGREVEVEVRGSVTIDAVEERYPQLRGTIRDHGTKQRRAYLRFFAGGNDLSHEPQGVELPEVVASGTEPFYVMGAISGG
ncbi:MAG: hypothetical protein WD960_04105 [Gemmatimonadota bacterium]